MPCANAVILAPLRVESGSGGPSGASLPDENKQKEDIVDGKGQMNLVASEGKVRIKVKSTAYEKIKICSRIEVDGNLYVVDSDPKVVGPFDAQFYSIYLKREN